MADDLDDFLKRTGRTPYAEAKSKPPPPEEETPDPSRSNVLTGALQGAVLSPIETLLAGGRWMTSRFDPDVMTADSPLNRAIAQGERFRKDVESTTPGMIGEVGGMFGTGYGLEAGASRALAAAPSWLSRLAGRTILGGAQGAISRPPSSLNELAAQTATGAALGRLRGAAETTAAKEAAKVAAAKYASVTASGQEQLARAAMAGVKKKDPIFAQLAEEYGVAREEARQARAAIPGKVPEGFWPFMHNLPHQVRLRLAQWLMSKVPPGAAGGAVGMGVNRLENPQ